MTGNLVDSLSFLASGIVMGLIAGISPGPMLTLVISQTLQHDVKEGIKISLSPLITDLPIILLIVLFLSKLVMFNFTLGIISILGAVFLVYMAYGCIVFKPSAIHTVNIKAQSIKKGIMANFLNPYPYLFWFSVGAPILFKAYHRNILSVVFFIAGFYACLIGSKIAIVLMVDKSKSFLNDNIYKYLIQSLGFVLLFFAFLFFKDGLRLFGLFH
jgi:threonine/homoserine/homoserine lactone efflux protein